MLSLFHVDEDIRDLCKKAIANADCFLVLDWDESHGQRYVGKAEIPPNTLRAVYSGSLEQFKAVQSLNHSMAMGKP